MVKMRKGFLLSLGVVLLGAVLISLVALFSHEYMDYTISQDNLFRNIDEKFEGIENVFQQIFNDLYHGNVYYNNYIYIEEELPFNSNLKFKDSVDNFIDFVKEKEDVDFEIVDNYKLIGYGDVNYSHGDCSGYDCIIISGGNSLDIFVNVSNSSVENINLNGQSGEFRLNVTAVGINGIYFNEEEFIDVNDNLVVNINLNDGSKVVIRSFNNENLIRILSESNTVNVKSLFYDDIKFSFVKVEMNFSDFDYYLEKYAEIE